MFHAARISVEPFREPPGSYACGREDARELAVNWRFGRVLCSHEAPTTPPPPMPPSAPMIGPAAMKGPRLGMASAPMPANHPSAPPITCVYVPMPNWPVHPDSLTAIPPRFYNPLSRIIKDSIDCTSSLARFQQSVGTCPWRLAALASNRISPSPARRPTSPCHKRPPLQADSSVAIDRTHLRNSDSKNHQEREPTAFRL